MVNTFDVSLETSLLSNTLGSQLYGFHQLAKAVETRIMVMESMVFIC
jgi:hypothetical protein